MTDRDDSPPPHVAEGEDEPAVRDSAERSFPSRAGSSTSRRTLLRRAAAASLYATPLFVTLGASAAESSAYEQAQRFLGNAQRLVSQARKAESGRQRAIATEARTELTEARAAARSASKAERRRLRDPMEAVAADIRELLGNSR